MKYSIFALLLICSACREEKKEDNSIYVDMRGADTIPPFAPLTSLGSYYCCDTIRTLNHTALVKSILDTAGNLTDFEIVKVLK